MISLLYETLVKNGTALMILHGLLVTLEISALSVFFGTLLGTVICAFRMSRNKILHTAAKLYIAVIRGSPVLLLLMLMYYVIFARTNLSAPLIAVSAFSLNVSAHAAECFRAALLATDKKQTEAARTLGFSKLQAFILITLPQAAKNAKPTYQSVIINLIQWTSVAGYVTITDLTRVINNISSRTMQPFIMIVTGILLYLGIAYICYGIFALSGKIAERRNNRQAK